MEIPGFYFDEQRKKYFRIESGNSGQNRVTRESVRQKSSLEAIDDYQRSDRTIHLPQTLHKQEINSHSEYNFREEVIRSRLKAMKKKKTFDIEVNDFRGDKLRNPTTDWLIGSPESNNLFAVLSGDTGSVVYQLSVEDVFEDDYNVNDKKHVINAFPINNRVIDMSFISDPNCDLLSTLVHHFHLTNKVSTSFSLSAISDQRRQLMREVYEFAEPIFSATHFKGMNILGGEKQVYVFKPSHSGSINIIKFNENITALKTSKDGKMFIAGTNRGQLAVYDIKDSNSLSKRSVLKLFDKSLVYVHCLNDSNRVIVSGHDHCLCLTDLRMFDKPVVKYLNHSNNCSKIAFSVDESVDVLCSAGDDNLVRFWSINSGKLLHMYCPTTNSQTNTCLPSVQPKSNVWYSDSWNFVHNKSKPLMFSMSKNQLNVVTVDHIDDD